MKLLILSDIHLEFAPFHPVPTDHDAVILAGDIGVGPWTVGKAAKLFPGKPIIFVPGNHEYYKTILNNCAANMREEAEGLGVHFLDNNEVEIDGVRFIGSTLWTDFRLFGDDQINFALGHANGNISDFHVIRYGSPQGRFQAETSVKLHQVSVEYLESRLNEKFNGKTVVVTHHLPHRRSVSTQYEDDILSAAFASDLSRLMGKSALWVHGHTHDSFDYVENGTRVVCNPRGYLRRTGNFENPNFNPGLVVEI